MRRVSQGVRIAVLLVLGLAAVPAAAQSLGMRAFRSDQELAAFLKRRAVPQRRTPPPFVTPPSVVFAPPPIIASPVVTSASPDADDAATIAVTAAPAAAPSITNTQEADVDEGGIVKVHGNHLVVLRRGRLFTVALNAGTMRAIDRIDAFPPGTNGKGAWYDEMLIAGDRIVVIGFSYQRGGTEINRFRIDPQGRLTFEDSYHLRSNDYYSSTNYASRLIGTRLIVYTPLDLDIAAPIARQLPALSRSTGRSPKRFQRIAPAARVYLPEPARRDADAEIDTLHTVTVCDLVAPAMTCRATGVLGAASRNFYVSGRAVYVWIGEALNYRRAASRGMVYRLPLDGGRPGAVQAWGGPIDQFSFREDRSAGVLNVVVRADSGGERMWRALVSQGNAALLRLPLSAFGNGNQVLPARAYRALPVSRGDSWSFHNRFVGNHLIYAAGEFAVAARAKTIFAVPLKGGAITRIQVPHGVDRIDIMGTDAVTIGSDAAGRLGFSAIELTGTAPRLGDTSFLPAAREGEQRSQAFFYRPDPDSADGASGTLGLPVSRDLGTGPAARLLGSGSAVAFLRRDAKRLRSAGELEARSADARDDACQASCTDWYGNARPIFFADRIFALMGYEIAEGSLDEGRIREIGRVSFQPRPTE